MEFLVLILAGLLWLGIGFVGRCMVKGYFLSRFSHSLGPRAWDNSDKLVGYLVTIAGPIGLTVGFVFWLNKPRKHRRFKI